MTEEGYKPSDTQATESFMSEEQKLQSDKRFSKAEALKKSFSEILGENTVNEIMDSISQENDGNEKTTSFSTRGHKVTFYQRFSKPFIVIVDDVTVNESDAQRLFTKYGEFVNLVTQDLSSEVINSDLRKKVIDDLLA